MPHAAHAADLPGSEVPAGTVPYRALPGDTLYSVAERYLRDRNDWRVLAQLNHVAAPRRLQPGSTLRLPVALLKRDSLAARVVATSGAVERLSRAAPPLPLANGTSLGESDAIGTGADGFATIEFDDGTHISIAPQSTVEFRELARTVVNGSTVRRIDLRRGEVDNEVTHAKSKQDRFEIHAPSIVAGVRGTRFRVSTEPRASAVEVLDGTVAVDGEHALALHVNKKSMTSGQLLPAGYGNVTQAGKPVGTAVALLHAPELMQPDRVQSDPDVRFELMPLEGARRYHFEIARDAGMLDRIRELRTNGPNASFDDLADDTYFVRVSGIDDAGLEGIGRIYAFERRRSQVIATATPAHGTRNYTFRWLASRAGVPTQFRFILSRNDDLRDPLIDAVDLSVDRLAVAGLPPGVYYWVVVAEQFERGRFYETASGVHSFTLAN
ncbi:FecR domain-containing protein [Trinickia sp. LjRoot230]|uniref:FecR family protein n=1 Tax=Trinickia sp. LjRoot230 TaxID=3342288 RepID=UPI003ED170AF